MSGPLLRISLALFLLATPGLAQDPEGTARVRSSLDLEIYGYLKLDAAYDSARTSVGDFVKWVELVPENPDDDVFSMTANESRLGLKFEPRKPDDAGTGPRLVTRGRIEIDFFGGGAANKSHLMLRHAYIEAVWPGRGLKLLAGQTSDVISPLNPKTLNYSVAWWAGNIGYRRPQVRLTRKSGFGEGHHLVFAAALARTIGATDSEFTSNDAGSDSGLPTLQARLGLSFANGSSVGFSGHVGEEEFDLSAAGDAEVFDSWSANIDYKQKLAPRVVLQAEAFTGSNLQVYLGGIGQGVDVAAREEIDATGGWLSLDFGPYERAAESGASREFHLGASVDDVDDADVATGARTRNTSVFASGLHNFNQHLQMGLELSWWSTSYKDEQEPSSFRSQFSVLYRF
jgi:hypothetical protein